MPNMGMARMRRMLIEWAWFGAATVLLIGMLLAGLYVIEAISPSLKMRMNLTIALSILYVLAYAAAMLVFVFRLREANNPRPYRITQKIGIPVSATVLDAMPTGIKSRNPRGIHPTHYEYQLRLHFALPDAGEYEAQTIHYFKGGEIPKKGAVLAVKVHPHDPNVVVIA